MNNTNFTEGYFGGHEGKACIALPPPEAAYFNMPSQLLFPLDIAKPLLNLQYLHFIFLSISLLKMLAVSLSHSIQQKPVNSNAWEPGAPGAHLCSDKVGLLLAAIGTRLTMRKDGGSQ